MLIRKYCENCGKPFVTKSSSKKYCTAECRKKAYVAYLEEIGQICWRCKNATGNCSWSRSLQPVESWDANAVSVKNDEGDEYRTYEILHCPEFIHD